MAQANDHPQAPLRHPRPDRGTPTRPKPPLGPHRVEQFPTPIYRPRNVYLNGSILGMTRKEINANQPGSSNSPASKIIDTPVKRYSSGMAVRLGFAISGLHRGRMCCSDEVLAVGDTELSKPLRHRMEKMAGRRHHDPRLPQSEEVRILRATVMLFKGRH